MPASQIAVVGVPIGRSCISENHGWTTPPAFREQLRRFPLWDGWHARDLSEHVTITDLGDIEGDEHDADSRAAHHRIHDFVRGHGGGGTLVLIGGDNSLTRPALQGLAATGLDDGWGVLTLDAHHDTRPVVDGISRNGTPIRELIDAGLPGPRVAQIGIQRFANNRETSEWALTRGVHRFTIDDVRNDGIRRVMEGALQALRHAGARRIYVDLDMDVHDIAFAPGCPASMPGGLTPAETRVAAEMAGSDPDVVAIDFTEVDASRPGGAATVRLMADLFLHFCAGRAALAAS